MFLLVERVRVPRAFVVAAALAAGWLAFYAAWIALSPFGERGLLVFADTAYVVPIAAATVLSLWAARRAVRGMRVFWGIVAASNALWLGAELLWSVRELGSGSVPFPWWTDVGYLSSYALLVAAIPAAFRPSFRTVRLAGVLDGAIVIGALALVWWWIVLRPLPLGANHVRGPEPDVLLEGSRGAPQMQLRQLRELVASVDARADGGSEHSARVAAVSRQLALELELEPADAASVELAGLLHALGNLTLTDVELGTKRRDPHSSAEIVSRIPAVRHVAAIVAAQRECWNGSGSPRGLAGEAIPIGARIVAVAHELVSLLDGTRHGASFSLTAALTEIWRHADGRFDPVVVSALFRVLREGGLESLQIVAPEESVPVLAS